MTRGSPIDGINCACFDIKRDPFVRFFFPTVIMTVDQWLQNIPPPIFFPPEHGTITQVLSCTLHMLNTVTCIATEVLIGLGEPVLHREARDILFGRSVGSRFNCACQACRCACKKGENRRVRVVFKKERGGQRHSGTCVCVRIRACMCVRVFVCVY